jgi:TolB-like protein/lipopolysaccharide biosynthesis regulator YciM
LRAEERLLDLAASVADGAAVDWTTAEAGVRGTERDAARTQRIVRHLRLVSDVAELYRSLPDTGRAAPEFEPPQPTGPKWGRLVLLDRVGEGTSSEVYRAWDPELQREVALKLLKVDGSGAEAARWRLLGEARRLARVRHSHVVIVFGADRRDERVGLWMEFVKGSTLDDIVRRNGPLGAREAAVIGLDLCGALAAVHAAGLVHRDIKAQNVMRETGGRNVLMDFGTGEEIKQASGSHLAGTPLYLAPELFARKAASTASDLYSLGVLLFYLVTGQFPVASSTFEELARAHQRRESRRLRDVRPDLPEQFVEVVERALSYDPTLRYESAGSMEAALRQALDRTRPIDVAPPSTPKPRSVWRWVPVAAGLAAALALGVMLSRRAPEPPTPAPAVATVAPLTQIAVLPLADLSGGTAPAYLADALTDQLIGTLGQVRALRVTSRTSVLQFKNPTKPMREIAQALDVGSVLEGTLYVGAPSPSGERLVSINARLIAAGTDTQLWAQTFQRQLGDLFALEADIAQAVARAVNVALGAGETARLQQGTTTNAAAAEAYFQGRYHLNQFGPDNFRRAVTAFQRAVKLDPNYAVAHAGLASAYRYLGSVGAISRAEAKASAQAAASRALELNEATAEAHSEIGDIRFYYDWDFVAAGASYDRALELNPSYSRARIQRAQLLSARVRPKEAVAEMRRAEELDPLSAEVSQFLAMMLYYAGDYEGALKELQKARTLDERSPRTYVAMSRVHEARREWKEAIAAMERAIELSGARIPAFQAGLARTYALSGNTDEARRRLPDIEKGTPQGSALGPARLAYVYVAMRDDDRAFTLLDRAVAERDPDVLWIGVDPTMERLRNSSRFQDLIRRIGLP